MIVVDTNVVARFVLRGDGATIAERVLERDASWVAPPLAHSELRNVLATSMRARRITLEDALVAVSIYDCEFVSVAQDLGVPLVTSDRQVLAAFPQTAVSPEAFIAH